MGFLICGEDVCEMWPVSSWNIKELYVLGREDILFANFFDGADWSMVLSFVNLGRLRAISTASSLIVL